MVRGWSMRIFACILIAAIVATVAFLAARVQSADKTDALNQQVTQLYNEGKYAEATVVAERALILAESSLGPEHPGTLTSASNLARLYESQNRYDVAEPLYQRALAGRGRVLGPEHGHTLTSVNDLAMLYEAQGRYDEAEPLYKRALSASERVLGLEHPDTLTSVNNLASLYQTQHRYDEAEPLFKRAFAARERVLGGEHPDTLISVNNLGGLYKTQGRYDKAEPLYQRALAGRERVLGPEHPNTLTSINNLARLHEGQGRYEEAEPLYQRALTGFERVLGLEHLNTLTSVNILASLYQTQGRYGEAEPLYERALVARERVLGPEHPDTLGSVNNLATVHFEQRDWPRAVALWRRSTAGIAGRTQRATLDTGQAVTGKRKSEAEQLGWQFSGLVKSMHRLTPEGRGPDEAASREMFETAQSALSSEAAQSLAQMAARGAKGDPKLAAVVWERQNLVTEWQKLELVRNVALGQETAKRDAKAEAENAARLATIDTRIAGIDRRLAAEFEDYAALASPAPLPVEEAQAQLGVDEALVLFLDTPEWTPTPEETFIWVVTKTDTRWVRSDLGKVALTRDVQALRCGLDEEEWATPTNAKRCADLLGLTEVPDASRPLPFHPGKAHALYQGLFGQIEDMIAGKRLLIVPSGALTSLPFHVLVTKAPGTALPDAFAGYRDVAWLGRSNAITTLPAVSSLKALRQHAANRAAASDAYAGYGNPLLSGDGASCRVAKSPEACPGIDVAVRPNAAIAVETTGSTEVARATVRGRGGRRSGNATTDDVFAKGSTPEALLTQVRGLCPLPDTEYEINCVANRFAAKASLIRLAGEARETDIKALSESGRLAQYRVLHFATHGLLSGDVERMAQRQGEPALVLTPPDKPADADDDGLLMASEVAALKLNADWVVMSACNTAAGDKIGAQALSGLARAFFYAGGRALLVSHWPVYSDAAVRLTTSTFAELDRNPKAGRAEALQRAMNALMDDRSRADNAHPAVWAPFVVVGESGR